MAFFLHMFRNVVRLPVKRLGARPRAVFEDEAVLEVGAAEEIERGLKLGISLAAETDDEVARHGRVRDRLPHPAKHLHVFTDGIAAFHPREHGIGTMLSRHMQVVADLR